MTGDPQGPGEPPVVWTRGWWTWRANRHTGQLWDSAWGRGRSVARRCWGFISDSRPTAGRFQPKKGLLKQLY